MFNNLPTGLPTYTTVGLSVLLPTYLSVCLPTCLHVYLSTYLNVSTHETVSKHLNTSHHDMTEITEMSDCLTANPCKDKPCRLDFEHARCQPEKGVCQCLNGERVLDKYGYCAIRGMYT